ncbi:universal stress protein UspA-like nucleotide-binding protein [Paramagnetospirillum caucaseum]|uniref:Universal stress protein UspA-like nucleotide-binding protein n=1 Tax=Paramagnetospirillum caucaseum TaxID=1244869 RepID=M3A5T1_9PROT|nr:universal stress protein [Paramagnetospirillum caucaseum]EME68148.1 universal stress protein UspA-like nucleotide-binding protein [Paramagnetospirillum caucaseum]
MQDIIVHLDEPASSEARLAVAKAVAGKFGARLSALFARSSSNYFDVTAGFPGDHVLAASRQARALFERECGPGGRWMELLHGEPDFLMQETAFCARYSNLTVLGQPDEGRHMPENLVERVILHSGAPVLVVPHHGRFETVGAHIMVGWNASRECARAVHDALPLLRKAASVTLAVMNAAIRPDGGRSEGLPPVAVLDHLAANGVAAGIENLVGEGVGAMDLLLSRAADVGADLLVMGASTHGPFSSFGPGFRHVLGHMTLPVLFSH